MVSSSKLTPSRCALARVRALEVGASEVRALKALGSAASTERNPAAARLRFVRLRGERTCVVLVCRRYREALWTGRSSSAPWSARCLEQSSRPVARGGSRSVSIGRTSFGSSVRRSGSWQQSFRKTVNELLKQATIPTRSESACCLGTGRPARLHSLDFSRATSSSGPMWREPTDRYSISRADGLAATLRRLSSYATS